MKFIFAPTPPHSKMGRVKDLICLLFLLFFSHTQHSIAQCFAQISGGSSDIPTSLIRPFCNSNGFTVTTSVEHDENCTADVYVIIETSLKTSNSYFLSSVISPIERYFSNIQYAPVSGSPTLTQTHVLSSNQKDAILFRFRVTLPAETGTTTFNFPFAFAPNFFFGDVPWRVWVSADEPSDTGLPQIPPMPPSGIGTDLLVGTLQFQEPDFRIPKCEYILLRIDRILG